MILVESADAAAGFQRNEIAALTGFQERAVDVGAMGNAVWLTEALHEFGVERHVGNKIAGQRVAHFLRRRAVGVGQHGVLQPDLFQHAENIGAVAGMPAPTSREFGRLLENPHGKSVTRQRIGRDQAANAAAGYEKRRFATILAGHGQNFLAVWKRVSSPRRIKPAAQPDAKHGERNKKARRCCRRAFGELATIGCLFRQLTANFAAFVGGGVDVDVPLPGHHVGGLLVGERRGAFERHPWSAGAIGTATPPFLPGSPAWK